MDAIAEKAEVSRGTLFNYFPAKETLLVPFAGELYNQYVQPEILAYLDTQPTTFSVLQLLLLRIEEKVLVVPDIGRAFRHEIFHRSSPTMKAIMSNIGFFDVLLKIIHSGQQKGEVRSDIPADILAHYIATLYISLIHPMAKQAEQHAPLMDAAETETLLAFLRSALHIPA
jgi:AcrR family transcriptional regulator